MPLKYRSETTPPRIYTDAAIRATYIEPLRDPLSNLACSLYQTWLFEMFFYIYDIMKYCLKIRMLTFSRDTLDGRLVQRYFLHPGLR
jgi:hypothetical protein